MARINVEDSLWSDARFLKLCAKLGDEFRAVGVIVLAWKLAQKFWCPDRSPISNEAFFDAGLPEELISSGLALRTEDGIMMRGSEEHFKWWFERREAGKKGGEAAKKSRSEAAEAELHLSSSSAIAELHLGSSTAQANHQQKVPSSSFSFSGSKKRKERKKNTGEPPEKSGAPENLPQNSAAQKTGRDLVAVYCECWQKTYRSKKSPVIMPHHGKMLKDLGLRAGAAAEQMIRAFLAMPDTWFVTKRHDIPTLMSNLNAVTQFIETGMMVSKSQLRDTDEKLDEVFGPPAPRIQDILAQQEEQSEWELTGGHDDNHT